MTKHRLLIAAATNVLIGILLPVAFAKVLPITEPVIPELDRLANKDQPISLQLDHMTAAKALSAIAATGGLSASMEGPSDCCTIELHLNEVPLRRSLELFAAQTDARFEVVSSDRLRVWLPEMPVPGEDGITMPVIVKRVEPIYPRDARDARAEGKVELLAVVRSDGTVGNVEVMRGVAGWPSLDEAAIAAVRQRTYQPAMKNGQPVSVYYAITIRWQLR
jgi:TonB family protein